MPITANGMTMPDTAGMAVGVMEQAADALEALQAAQRRQRSGRTIWCCDLSLRTGPVGRAGDNNK